MALTEQNMKHMLEVARKMYNAAVNEGLPETYCRYFWLIGYLHDIGKEFGDEKHALTGGSLLSVFKDADIEGWKAVANHGKLSNATDNLLIETLNVADLMTGPAGEDWDIKQRLADIKERYSDSPEVYKTVAKLAKIYGLKGGGGKCR